LRGRLSNHAGQPAQTGRLEALARTLPAAKVEYGEPIQTMRCNWRRWLWGVIPLVGVSVAAVHLERGAIEKDLTDRARQALAASGAHWADVNFSGRDVVLGGNATAENEPPEAEAILRNQWGVRHVNNNAGLPPRVEPYLWYATRRGDRVRLHGHVPSRVTRQTIIGMTTAALPGVEVVDRMRTARGVPPTDTWLAGLSFALKQLAALKRGEVRLEDLALTVSGEAENAAEYRAVTAALKGSLPKGITLARMHVAAPVVSPYTWSAQFAGGQLVLSGHVADDSAKAELLAAAATAPAGTGVVDRLEAARGAPTDFAGVAAVLIKQIVKLQSGNAEMKDTAVTVGGVAVDEVQVQGVREALRTLMPPAFKLTDQIRVREAPKVELKTETKVGPKAEAKPPGEPLAPAPIEQQSAGDPQPKADMQPTEAPPAPAEKQTNVDAQPDNAAPQPPTESQPGVSQPATKEARAKVDEQPDATAAGESQPVTAAPPQDVAPPASAATPAQEPQTKVAASGLPTAPEAAPAPATPPAAAAPAAPVEPVEKPPAPSAPAADAAPKPESAPPSPDLGACREDLAKIAAANPVTFERGSAKLDAEGIATLAKIATAVKACPGVRIAAEGHTDIEGGPDYNRRLSIKRARVVADSLVKSGVAADMIETAGFGASRPIASNTTAQARAKNRRTEILVRPK
jgi:outer membrane protein OmpA-like peptidoglycan-associated protein